METVDDETVPILAVLEPFGDARDSRLTEAGRFLYARVWLAQSEHLRGLEALPELFDLIFCHEVAQETPRLRRRFERKECRHELLIFRLIPVHIATLAKWSTPVKWSTGLLMDT